MEGKKNNIRQPNQLKKLTRNLPRPSLISGQIQWIYPLQAKWHNPHPNSNHSHTLWEATSWALSSQRPSCIARVNQARTSIFMRNSNIRPPSITCMPPLNSALTHSYNSMVGPLCLAGILPWVDLTRCNYRDVMDPLKRGPSWWWNTKLPWKRSNQQPYSPLSTPQQTRSE
jgi:hypothetical protein